MNYFEKSCYLKDINYELFSEEWKPLEQKLPARFGNEEGRRGELNRTYDQASFLKYYVKPGEQLITKSKAATSKISNDVLPEYLSWAISAGGISSSR